MFDRELCSCPVESNGNGVSGLVLVTAALHNAVGGGGRRHLTPGRTQTVESVDSAGDRGLEWVSAQPAGQRPNRLTRQEKNAQRTYIARRIRPFVCPHGTLRK